MEYRYGSHTVFNIEYHFVWVTKYRYKVLTGDVGQRVRELIRQSCDTAFPLALDCHFLPVSYKSLSVAFCDVIQGFAD